jgi:hypothetical protein
MANMSSRGQQRDKPFRDALRMEIAEAAKDRRDLRVVARKLIDKAAEGDVRAIEELANRLDGKVPQAIVGDEEHPPVSVTWLNSSQSPTSPEGNSTAITTERIGSPKSSPTEDSARPSDASTTKSEQP